MLGGQSVSMHVLSPWEKVLSFSFRTLLRVSFPFVCYWGYYVHCVLLLFLTRRKATYPREPSAWKHQRHNNRSIKALTPRTTKRTIVCAFCFTYDKSNKYVTYHKKYHFLVQENLNLRRLNTKVGSNKKKRCWIPDGHGWRCIHFLSC